MEQIVDGLGKIVEGINSVDAAIDSNRVNEIIYIKIIIFKIGKKIGKKD